MLKSAAPGLTTLALLISFGTDGADDRPIDGTWTSGDRTTSIEIAARPEIAGALCARVAADKPAAGEPSVAGKQVAVNFVRAKCGWAGQVLADDGSALPATITLRNAARLGLRVGAVAMFCDETSYSRVGS